MYLDEYKRWMAAELEDADLKPELARSREMMTRSRTALLWLRSLAPLVCAAFWALAPTV